ncbi:ATPase [Mycobacterium sp. 852002-51613_SCH5001154]|uniref:ATPase n=1 Tax=unclassified Mycobacterium TaxID=2642494 RepID=UPI0007FF9F2D|nr:MULTISPECIES: ATPase [unclassified Mycobacterium]OBF78390.1 ATPase [Mycobacterium sp. 852002-51613_SCH5001154]OBF97625.1 ATPase [Mycobacterium sp. 852014-52450_SCH5900713]
MSSTAERYVVTRTIAATPAEIFAVLVDPARHQNTEPTDWVRDSVDTAPITRAGQMFAMNMYLDRAGGDYVTHNLVNVFDTDRAIGWMPGVLDEAGNHNPGGWFWRYDLAPNGNHTDVTLTYDWSGTPQEFRDRVGDMPIFGEDYLAASLATLERSVAN